MKKKCPICGTMNRLDATKCTNMLCTHRFVVNCRGCGRDTLGREYCKECVTPGIYPWQKI